MIGAAFRGAAVTLLLVLLSSLSPRSDAVTDSAPSRKQSSSTIAITANGTTLLIVNPDSNSLTLVDTASHSVVAEMTVGVDPRSVAVSPDGSTAYVANQGNDSLSIVNLTARAVITEVAVGDRPVGVALSPDGCFVAVAEMGVDRVRLIDAATLSTVSVIAVADRPHGLAFTPNGQVLLVTHLLSGDVTQLFVRPFAIYLPLIVRTSAASYNGHPTGLTSADSLRTTIPTWPNVAPAPSIIVNTTGTRAYLPQSMANGLGLNTSFDTTVFPKSG